MKKCTDTVDVNFTIEFKLPKTLTFFIKLEMKIVVIVG